MASRFKPLIKAFGASDGIKFYFQFKGNSYGSFFSNQYGASFHLRKNFSDQYTFNQVFIDDQYKIEFPFIPKTIIDGGANIGLSSAYFAHRYPEASIVAVEPSANNFEVLQKNIAAFPKVKGLNKGIWNKEVHLHIINEGENDNAFMVEETSAETKEAIPAISIERIMKLEGWETIDILKLDIEGSEKEVFELNYEYWLPRTRAIIIELHDHMRPGASKALFKAISQYNFSFTMQHENLIFVNKALL
jgi:FkbM family methyltransferase